MDSHGDCLGRRRREEITELFIRNKMIKQESIQKAVYPIVNTVIRVFLALIITGLCLQSMFSTSFIGRIVREDGSRQERTLNIADDPWRHLGIFLLFTVVGLLIYHIRHVLQTHMAGKSEQEAVIRQEKGREGFMLWIMSCLVLLSGTAWILLTQLAPGSDPAKVFGVAMQWRHGDFSAYAEGGYLFRYPFQAGIVLFYYFLSFLFGVDNYVGAQFVNVLALTAIYVLLAKLAALFWKRDRKISVIVYAALILWVPLAFYITYLYGILPGMALSLGAVYSAAKYIDTRKYRYIVPACICMGLATVIKTNCLIYLIAIACFLLYNALDTALLTRREPGKQWIVSLTMIVLMSLSVMGCNRVTERYVEYLSGYEAGDGEAMISWVVMGLQETPLGPGGYSGYIAEVFLEQEYDTERIIEASMAEIRKILIRMSENILDDGIPFFARKNAFQWNDPTFISLDRTRNRAPATDLPAFAVSLIEGRGSVILSVWLNYAQTLLLIGALFYLLFQWKSDNMYELMGAVVFLGGYLFHFVWESSASYTIPYFVVMIPYAAKGLTDWIRYVAGVPAAVHGYRSSGKKFKDVLQRHKVASGGCTIMIILLILFAGTNLFKRTIALDDGEEARAQFYRQDAGDAGFLEKRQNAAYMAGIRDGYYYVSPWEEPGLIIVEKDGEVTVASVAETVSNAMLKDSCDQEAVKISTVDDLEHKILLHSEKKSGTGVGAAGIRMRFRSNEQALAAVMQEEGMYPIVFLDDGMNLFYEPNADVVVRWNFRKAEEGGYYITIDDLALTCRNGEITLEELTEDEGQRWVLWQ